MISRNTKMKERSKKKTTKIRRTTADIGLSIKIVVVMFRLNESEDNIGCAIFFKICTSTLKIPNDLHLVLLA